MNNEIVRQNLSLIQSNGERMPIEIIIGAPYSHPDDHSPDIICWHCPVQIPGLQDKMMEIGGDDAFEAIVAAIMFVKRALIRAKRNGCRIVFVDSGEDYPIEEIFGTGDCSNLQ